MGTEKSENKGGDFRYAVNAAKVPWHAVGEYFNGEDLKEIIRFLLPPQQGESTENYDKLMGEIGERVDQLALMGGRATKLTLGQKVAEAEEAARSFFRSKYALFTSNWTCGMEIAYKLAGLKAGDEVIMPAITFIATMAYPLSIGAKIVFADIDPETVNLDPADVAKKITPKTKMIVPVHIGGCPVDMDPIMDLAKKHGLVVMEDAAHGMGGCYKGKMLGTIGDFGGFSLHEVKNINSLGEGGILLAQDDFYGKQLTGARFLGLDFTRKIKDWLYDISPLTDRFRNVHVAQNCSATEIQALGMLLQMKRLNKIIGLRRAAAEYMNGVLSQEDGILVEKADTADTWSTHHLYLLRINPAKVGGNIQQLSAKLAAKGLTNITHFGPMYRFKVMKDLEYDEDAIAATCPATEQSFYQAYTHLPLYPLTKEQLEYQAQAVVEAVREMKAGK